MVPLHPSTGAGCEASSAIPHEMPRSPIVHVMFLLGVVTVSPAIATGASSASAGASGVAAGASATVP